MRSSEPPVHIGSFAVAVPPFAIDQPDARAFMEEHFGPDLDARSRALLHKSFSHPSIRRRHLALGDPHCLIGEDPDDRVARFTTWAVDLAAQAAATALAQAGLGAADVAGLVVNTCTGYLCPGISTYLIERLGLSPDVRAYDLVGSGCGGAVANLQVAERLQRNANGKVTLSVAVEICSATFQMGTDPALLVSNALFSDGAAAAVLWEQPRGLEMAASGSRYAPEHREDIRYVHRHGALHNQLSPQLPQIIRKPVAELVGRVLEPDGLKVSDVQHWALHAGGEKIIHALQEELQLGEEQTRSTRRVLADYGNLSSPTVWFVLRDLLASGVAPGERIMMLAFGAGFSAHALLLRACRDGAIANGKP